METIAGKPVVFQHAFIAIHHDEILAVGCDDWHSYVDKDTRIIDGRGHIGVPGFLEVQACLSSLGEKDGMRLRIEEGMRYMRHGTLTLCADDFVSSSSHHVCFEIQKARPLSTPIITPYQELAKRKKPCYKRFCISSFSPFSIQDQLSAAQLLAMEGRYDCYQLLKALTCWPAIALKQKNLGHIARHAQADILLFAGQDLKDIFYTLGNEHLTQIIKSGIRVYPYILVS